MNSLSLTLTCTPNNLFRSMPSFPWPLDTMTVLAVGPGTGLSGLVSFHCTHITEDFRGYTSMSGEFN